jgi:hypothetical protein
MEFIGRNVKAEIPEDVIYNLIHLISWNPVRLFLVLLKVTSMTGFFLLTYSEKSLPLFKLQ